jgi:hypothetical protein
MNWIIATILSLAIMFAWGGILFVFFRYRYGRSVDDRKRFLEIYFRFFTFRTVKAPYAEVTPKVLREAGHRGWGMISLPIVLLSFGMTFWNIVLSAGMLFFGGLSFALSWYGLRCLRGLSLDSYSTDGPNKSAMDKPDPAVS